MPALNFEHCARDLLDKANDVKAQYELAVHIRDNIEVVHMQEYGNFLNFLFPVFYNHLRTGAPKFNDSIEQKLRNVMLEILNRLPSNDLLKQGNRMKNLMQLAMFLLEVENEENAIICVRIIIELHKNFRPHLETEVQPFLEIVQKFYSELPKTVNTIFNENGAELQGQAPSDPQKPSTSIRSTQSFKVLTECPIIVVLLFQLYPRFLQSNIPKFMPLVIQTLGLQAPKPTRESTLQYRIAFVDFIAAQVKTLSFLAYLLRGWTEHVQPHQEAIPKCVINLLQNCPDESSVIRKELLIATRHILATEFRSGFTSHLDTLLDEKVLIGSGRTAYETLRPLAYSTLADLVHQVRVSLTFSQLTRVVYLYSRNIHDSSLPFCIQTMSAKLLLNLLEFIVSKNSGENEGKGKVLVMRIFDTFVNKFGSLKKQIPRLFKPQVDKSDFTGGDVQSTDNIKDCRLLMKSLVVGLKNITWAVNMCTSARQGQPPGAALPPPVAVSAEETFIYSRLLKNALRCMMVFSVGPNPAPQDEKEALDHFATMFTMVDSRIFQEVFNIHMPFLFERMLENQTMLTIPQHFLAHQIVSRIFADILLNFLMDRMKQLAGPDKTASVVLLRLFKLVFGSVTLFSDNEPVLQPHLATIVTMSLKYAGEVKDSMNYFVLLRALFRSIGGKFDALYKEFLPLLPALLDTLNRLESSAHSQSVRDLFAELCLTVPVRLSALLPCLRLLMRPLVVTLESNSDLATQGLRTLELFVDNLSPEFFQPILNEVHTDLMMALWKHLKPAPSPHGTQALRIIGKLAGRNRRFLKDPLYLTTGDDPCDTGLRLTFNVDGTNVQLPFGRCASLTKRVLLSPLADEEAKKNAFTIQKTLLLSMFGLHKSPTTLDDGVVSGGIGITKTKKSVELSNHNVLATDQVLLQTLLTSLFIAYGSGEKMKEFTGPFFMDVCRHFAMLFTFKSSSPPNPLESNPLLFVDAIVTVLSSENRVYAPAALAALENIIKITTTLLSSAEQASQLPVFTEVAAQLCHNCYKREWYFKSGGCSGINFLTSKMPVSWLRQHEVEFIRSLLFVLKDLMPEVSVGTVEEAAETLFAVVQTCNSSTPELSSPQLDDPIFSQVVSLLVSEMASPNATVRKHVLTCLTRLSELTKTEISSLLEPFKDTFLRPIFTKPLRTLPLLSQHGYVEALTVCLNLRPPLLQFTPQLISVIQEAQHIAESDEIAGMTKAPTHKTMQLYSSLRAASIELLSAAMTCPETYKPEQQDLRNAVIGVFFKALTLRSKEIVAAAKKGLASVIAQHRLPKELLQTSLRPILLNLADHKKLSVPLLQGLARLLELLTNCFNVTLGEKLLEHLQKWTDPKLTSQRIWKEGEEVKIAAAIVDIFHLLPQTAVKLLDRLVTTTIQLEANLPREISSPYREPLARFFNRYPLDTIAFFLDRLNQPPYGKLWVFILKSESSTELRKVLSFNIEKWATRCFTPGSDIQFYGVQTARILVKFEPEWLGETRRILDYLLDVWHQLQRPGQGINEDLVPLTTLREPKLLVKCFLNYCKSHPEEVDLLFHMLKILTVRTTIDFTSLRDFYSQKVAEEYTPQQKKQIMFYFLRDFFPSEAFSQEHKVQALQTLIIPMLSASSGKDMKDIVEPITVSTIVHKVLGVGDVPHGSSDEALSIELLQLATLLVRYMPNELVEHRKELIKFAWNHLKSEDTTSRQCAYVLVCRFIEAYDTPPKIILQVYVALLRAFQPEARSLVRQALDILTPALRKRLQNAGGDPKYPNWIKWTKKIIVEEGHTLAQLIHILQLLVRHPNMFYPCRGQFVQHMVHSLARIGLLPQAPIENRKLAIDMVELIVNWEKKRISEAKAKEEDGATPMAIDEKPAVTTPVTTPAVASPLPVTPGAGKKRAASEITKEEPNTDKRLKGQGGEAVTPATEEGSSSSTTTPNPPSTGDEELKGGIVETIVNFLIRVASTNQESKENTGLPHRALDLLRQALTIWPDVPIKFAFFEKLLAPAVEQPFIVCTGLQILNVILDHQLQTFIQTNITALQTALVPALTSDFPKILPPLCSLLNKIMKAYPMGSSKLTNPFYRKLGEIIETGLHNHEKITNIHNIIIILKTICMEQPDYLDAHLAFLTKMVQKLAKDHVSSRDDKKDDATPAPSGPAAAAAAAAQSNTPRTLKFAIGLINSRIQNLGDNKKIFLNVLSLLVEKSTDIELLEEVVKILKGWILAKESKTSVLSAKEKALFVLKMARFDHMAPSLQSAFLELVLHVYGETSATKDLSQIESAFMVGLRVKDPTTRNNFIQLLHKNVDRHGKSIGQRMTHILSTQNWEPLASYFWLKVALDMLLNVFGSKEDVIKLAAGSPHLPWFGPQGNPPRTPVLPSSSEEVRSIFQAHEAFIHDCQPKVGELIGPLRELMHVDTTFCYQLWIVFFPSAWQALSKEEQQKLARPVTSLLSKDFHSKQREKPNVVQALLEGLARCQPPVKLAPDVIKFLGKTYGVWHVASYLLESQLTPTIEERLSDTLGDLYTTLNEDDLLYGLLRKRCVVEDTKAALTLEQHGLWQRAQDVYLSAMNKASPGQLQTPAKWESSLWEDHWLECAKRLNQWDLILDYSKYEGKGELVLQSAWRVGDWQAMKDFLMKVPQLLDTPLHKVYMAYVGINEGKPKEEVEISISQAVQLCLHLWQSLPDVPGNAHIPHLQIFQRIVEAQESLLISKEVNNSNRVQSISEIKGVLAAWRERLPNLWEDIVTWNDVLTWRQYVFGIITNAFQSHIEGNSAIGFIGHHETAWSINRFAFVARKHQLIDVCLHSLNKIYSLPNIEIQDAFTKLREQVKCHFYSPNNYRAGLEIIHSTNLDYFNVPQKAEFFRLKGEFCYKMGYHEEAYTHFSRACGLFETFSKGWLSWANFCDRQYQETKDKKMTWAEFALLSYLQAIRGRQSDKARRMMARVLWLVSCEDEGDKLGITFEKHSESLMPWTWVPWIPELLSMLSRPEGARVKNILANVARYYPQALYYQLNYLILKLHMMQAKTPNPITDPSLINFAAALQAADAIMGLLRQHHAPLHSDISVIVEEITNNLRPEPEVILLDGLRAILNECYLQSATEVPPSLQKQLEVWCSSPLISDESSPQDLANGWDFTKRAMTASFLSKDSLADISVLIDNLKKFVQSLQTKINGLPTKLRLEALSPSLSEFQNRSRIEIPGQYTEERESSVEHHIRIERFNSEVYAVKKLSFSNRCLTVRGHTGTINTFYIQYNPTQVLPDEDHFIKLYQLFNRFFDRHIETRKRNVTFTVPTIISLSPHLRLIQANPSNTSSKNHPLSYISLSAIYEDFCAEAHLDPDAPLLASRKKSGSSRSARLQLFTDTIKNIPETVLMKFIFRQMSSTSAVSPSPTFSSFFAFKKHFTTQMAVSSFIGYIMGIGNRSTANLHFSQQTGDVLNTEFYPFFNSLGLIETKEAVPFRISPNMSTFMNCLGIEGVFNAVMTSCAISLNDIKTQLPSHVSLVLRDELLSWASLPPIYSSSASSSSSSSSPAQLLGGSAAVKEKTAMNWNNILGRLQSLAPSAATQEKKSGVILINKKVSDLIQAATSPQNLSQMDPTWHPWF